MMANPQRENGYTGIANEILEQITKLHLNGTQYSIILTLWRFTYGFQRCEHDLSVSFISKATDTSTRAIKKEIRSLISRNIILVPRESTKSESRVLRFNKDYDTWIEGNNRSPGEQQITSQGNNRSPLEGNKKTPKKETKENLKKDIVPYKDIIEYLNLKTGKNFSPKTDATIKFINGRWDEGRTFEDFKHVIDIKCSDWIGKKDREGKSLEIYLRPNTLFTPSNFENYLNQIASKPKEEGPTKLW